ncbi:hypothetical protein [Cohnella sp. GCM10027633]|uniref:hypothetical protein n=1 Tax=unclassified Cohnella TaxID=2636738 RepID=UPI0036323090
MSMNIGLIARALLGDAQPSADNARALELRIGQIVRGVLLELLDNQEGLLNINGMQVRAKLEGEMPVGRSMLLQVQPGSGGGLPMLKTLADATDAMPDEVLKDALKSFGFAEPKAGMEVLRGLKRDGYPISKETASYFNNAMGMKPAGVDAQSWMGAADVAFRRGLQPTETTLASLRQALFGQPLGEGLAELETAVAKWLSGEGGPKAGAAGKDAVAIGQRLQQLLAQGAALVAEGEAQLSGEAKPAAGQGEPAPSRAAAAAAELARPVGGNAPAGANADASRASAGAAQGQAAASSAAEEDGARAAAPRADNARAADATGVAAPRQSAAGVAADAARPQAAALPQAAPEGAPRGDAVRALAAGADEPRGNAPAPAGAQPAAPKLEAAWIGRFLQWLGAGHEHKLLHDAGTGAGAPPFPGADSSSPGQEPRPAADSLKSALLALATREDAPPALREAAQNLANQVTGQQLLLTSDRNPNAPLSHMTMFVPMKNGDGETTATVHVQSRRNRRGEWDADNCRLLFDLRMRHLGDTVVDVQVVDKIVSLRLLCDHPGLSGMIEQARDELSAGMADAGFQLSSFTTSPLPEWRSGSGSDTSGGAAAPERAAPAGAYAAKPYKGVDFRA